jgi:hypothetical protein
LKNACNYAQIFFTVEGEGIKQKEEVINEDNGGSDDGDFDDNDDEDDDEECEDDIAGGEVFQDAIVMLMLMTMTVKATILMIRC